MFCAGNDRHGRVDLKNNSLRSPEHFICTAVCKAEGEISVFVHWCNRNHGNVDRSEAFCIVQRAMAEKHRGKKGFARIEIFSVQRGAMPDVIGKSRESVLLHRLDGEHGNGIAKLYTVQFCAALRQSFVKKLRK